MAALARDGRVDKTGEALGALFGLDDFASPEKRAGVLLLAHALEDLHVIARGKQYKE